MLRVNTKLIFFAVLCSGMFLVSCDPSEKQGHLTEASISNPVEISYAKRFKAWKKGDITRIVVNSGESGEQFDYWLIPAGFVLPDTVSADQIIEIPVTKWVVTSTTHVPGLDLLEIPDYLVGFPNTNYISSVAIRSRIEQDLVKDIGTVNGLNFESLVELQPELVISYISGPDRSQLDQLDQSGIPYVLNLDFMEESPLGRAEWIKFIGLLSGRFELADSIFKAIEQDYLNLRNLAGNVREKPTVFSGLLYGDTWFAPGANSFAAKFIEHAGGNYSWDDQDHFGSVELSLEAVFDRNGDTEFWIGTGDYSSKQALAGADPRYSHFQAFKTDKIYNYHGSIGPTGGFEYFELGGARPDLVLADLIKILHPDLLPDHQLYFYQKLD